MGLFALSLMYECIQFERNCCLWLLYRVLSSKLVPKGFPCVSQRRHRHRHSPTKACDAFSHMFSHIGEIFCAFSACVLTEHG